MQILINATAIPIEYDQVHQLPYISEHNITGSYAIVAGVGGGLDDDAVSENGERNQGLSPSGLSQCRNSCAGGHPDRLACERAAIDDLFNAPFAVSVAHHKTRRRARDFHRQGGPFVLATREETEGRQEKKRGNFGFHARWIEEMPF
ncbi:MAG: hypothetical protein J6X10_03610 [Bacteroidales bacterium]|nr:hypothetical protein [Bacteroidales bacterium]